MPDKLFSGQKCDEKSIGQTVLHICKLPKTLPVTTIVAGSCNIALWNICLYFVEFSYHTVNTIRLTCPCSKLPAYPITQAAALHYWNFSTNSIRATVEFHPFPHLKPHLKEDAKNRYMIPRTQSKWGSYLSAIQYVISVTWGLSIKKKDVSSVGLLSSLLRNKQPLLSIKSIYVTKTGMFKDEVIYLHYG